jgi:hypothetical protein
MKKKFLKKNYFLILSISSLVLAFVTYEFFDYQISRIFLIGFMIISLINSIISSIKNNPLISEKIQAVIISILWYSVGILGIIVLLPIEFSTISLIVVFVILSIVFLNVQIYINKEEN